MGATTRSRATSVRRALAAVAVMSLASTLAACGGDDAGDDSAITVGILAPVTGAYADESNTEAIELAEKLIDEAGGVDGKEVNVKVYDTASDPQGALTVANKAVSDRVDIIIGGITTTEMGAIEPVISRAGIPHLHLANVDSEEAFNLNSPVEATSEATAAFARDVLKAKDVAIWSTSDEGSAANADLNAKIAKEAGLNVVVERDVAPTATDITPQVRALADADVIIAAGTPGIDTALIRTMNQNDIKVPLILSTGGLFQVTAGLTPPDQLRDAYINTWCTATLPLSEQVAPEATAYLEAFAAEYGDEADQGANAARYFDGIHLAADVVAGNETPEEQIEYLGSSVDYDGACGKYKSQSGTHYLGAADNAFIASITGGELKRAQ